jgi:hypothetical protein
MTKGANTLTVQLTIEEQQFIEKLQHEQGLEDLYPSNFVILKVLFQYKDQFIEKYGKEVYQEKIDYRSRTRLQIKEEKDKKEEAKEILAERKLSLKEREEENQRLKNASYKVQTETSRINAELATETQRKIDERREKQEERRRAEKGLKTCQKCRTNKDVTISIPYTPKGTVYYCKRCDIPFVTYHPITPQELTEIEEQKEAQAEKIRAMYAKLVSEKTVAE